MTTEPQPFSFTNPDVMASPFPHYRRLQREAPVFHDPVTGLYGVTRHDLIREVAAQPQLFSNKSNRQSSRRPEIHRRVFNTSCHFPETPRGRAYNRPT